MGNLIRATTFANLREDAASGDILVDLHGADAAVCTLRMERDAAALLAACISSQLNVSDKPLTEAGKTQIPTVKRSRPVYLDSGEPALQLNVDHRIPLVLAVDPGAFKGMRVALTKIEELQKLADLHDRI
jgi:hypothetical protein